MFQEYLEDSSFFRDEALKAAKRGDLIIARRFFRVSILCSYSALESFVNFIADTLEKGGNLEKHELAFLSDQCFRFNTSTNDLVPKREFQRIDDKLRFLIRLYNKNYQFSSSEWSHLVELKKFRDSIVHPRSEQDETSTSEYSRRTKSGLRAVIDIMNLLSQSIFRKQLRRKILDLIPS